MTVSLMGFKTAVPPTPVTLQAAVPADCQGRRSQVGALSERTSPSSANRPRSSRRSRPPIPTNLTGAQITSLPLTRPHRARCSLTPLPGFNTSGTARNSTVSGLAAQRHQHHARRHERPGQPPEDD